MDTLRPLGFGELFDRAITLYVRNIFAFVGMALFGLLPMVLFSWYSDSRQLSTGARLLEGVFHISPSASLSAATGHALTGTDLFVWLPLIAADSIVYAAICIGVRAARRGEPFAAAECLKRALQLWRPIMRLAVASIALFTGLFVAAAIVAAIVTAIGAGVFVLLGGGNFSSGMRLMPLVIGAFVLVVSACWIVIWNFALFDVVLEGNRVRKSIGTAARRLFSRGLFWRLVAIWACSLIMSYLAETFFLIPGGYAQLIGVQWADVALTSVADAVVMPFGVIVMALAYYDVRVRREGLDILQRIEPEMLAEHA
jgi:hypothetical protein